MFRNNPYAAASFYIDLMRPYWASHLIGYLNDSAIMAVTKYLASEDGQLFPEGSLGGCSGH